MLCHAHDLIALDLVVEANVFADYVFGEIVWGSAVIAERWTGDHLPGDPAQPSEYCCLECGKPHVNGSYTLCDDCESSLPF